MSSAYENLKRHLKLATRHLKQIRDSDKKVNLEELCGLEGPLIDLATGLIGATKQEGTLVRSKQP